MSALFTELLIPFEDAIGEAFERKKLKYAVLVADASVQGWQAHTDLTKSSSTTT